jgi:hypothetical protein
VGWCFGEGDRAVFTVQRVGQPRSLADNRKTWEKAFYFLLLQYRNKHLENFNPEPEQHRSGEFIPPLPLTTERRKRDPKRSSRPTSASRKAVPREDRRRTDSPRKPAPTASRPAPKSPATPSRVAGPRGPSMVDEKPAATIRIVGPPAGPRTPLPDKSPAAPVDPRLPKITVQRATPQAEAPATTGLGLSIPAPPASPSPNAVPNSPPLGGINVPQVQDAALQKFFHDIAEQLQLIGSASPRSSIVVDSPMGSPALSQGGDNTLPNTPLPTPLPIEVVSMEKTVAPVKPRPIPTRAATDGPKPSPIPDVQRRRSYLGDASARENVAPQRYSTQIAGEKMRKRIPAISDSTKRKSKRKFLLLSPLTFSRTPRPLFFESTSP